jgi:alanyl-tRNA synthetase
MPEYKALARLYDTFGTPRDLIRVGLEERGFAIEEDDFNPGVSTRHCRNCNRPLTRP